ncbi:MAG: FGGY-family carbohydrate kinase, partial [Pseudomonadota bacterium]
LKEVTQRCETVSQAVTLAGRKLIVPDFLGNRAPFANPEATAVIAGLTLKADLDDLIATYIAGVTGIGYGLRQIIQAQAQHGVQPKTIVISGGAGRSDAMKQLLADACGVPILSPTSTEPVLLGAAMLGAVGAQHFATVSDAMKEMSSIESRFVPAGGAIAELHAARFKAFEALQMADGLLQHAMPSE